MAIRKPLVLANGSVRGLPNGDSLIVPNLKIGNILSPDNNTLDYYEEGTFTPGIEGGTTAGSVTYHPITGGKYARIGNLVSVSFTIYVTATSGMVGAVSITGLPFLIAPGNENRSGLAIGGSTGWETTSTTSISGFFVDNTARISLLRNGSFSSVVAPVINFRIHASGSYFTD